jgi:nicotinamide-nucleotide amidase
MSINLAKKFIYLCIKKNIYVNLAESCTGGLISSKIIEVADASKVLKYSIVTYSNDSKKNLLKVPLNVLKNYGAVSEETASYMVRGLSKEKDISFSMAVTGIAGPSGGTKYKPVGLVFFSFLYNKKDILVKKKLFKGNRNIVREKAANYALKKSIEIIS